MTRDLLKRAATPYSTHSFLHFLFFADCLKCCICPSQVEGHYVTLLCSTMVGWHANVCYHPVMVELFNVSNATMCGTLTLKSASQDGHCNVAKFHHVWWTLKLRLKSSLEKWFHSTTCCCGPPIRHQHHYRFDPQPTTLRLAAPPRVLCNTISPAARAPCVCCAAGAFVACVPRSCCVCK